MQPIHVGSKKCRTSICVKALSLVLVHMQHCIAFSELVAFAGAVAPRVCIFLLALPFGVGGKFLTPFKSPKSYMGGVPRVHSLVPECDIRWTRHLGHAVLPYFKCCGGFFHCLVEENSQAGIHPCTK